MPVFWVGGRLFILVSATINLLQSTAEQVPTNNLQVLASIVNCCNHRQHSINESPRANCDLFHLLMPFFSSYLVNPRFVNALKNLLPIALLYPQFPHSLLPAVHCGLNDDGDMKTNGDRQRSMVSYMSSTSGARSERRQSKQDSRFETAENCGQGWGFGRCRGIPISTGCASTRQVQLPRPLVGYALLVSWGGWKHELQGPSQEKLLI